MYLKNKIMLWRAIAVFGMISLGVHPLWAYEGKQSAAPAAGQSTEVGGQFTLIDQNGKKTSNNDFHGRMTLVFFGFTHCPDICPVTIGTLSKIFPLLGDKANQVAALFITVDPQRDTPKVLKDYLASFDRRIVGLTGTPQQVKQTADAYKVYFAESKGSNKDGDYAVDHSSIVYMMGADGKYIRHFSYTTGEKEIADAILEYLK